MSNIAEEVEGLNVPKCRLSEFFDDVEGKLALLTGLVNYEEFGLTLEDVRKPVLVIGKPGIGKTCGIISSIKEMNKKLPKDKQLGFKKILLGQTVVGSLTGIPVSRPDGTVVRVQLPDLPNPATDGEYGVLFLDEITTADEMQIQPALGLADDSRSLGEYTLPEHWLVVGAGNGPDCTNFVRLDDMTLTRFMAYDINYNFALDFRPYAQGKGFNPDILAFLSFSPDCCVRTESSDFDHAGKMFPCPRTWERLNVEMKMRELRGKPVEFEELEAFAGKIVGRQAAREFSAFVAFKKNLHYDPKKILQGTEADPAANMTLEEYHIINNALDKLWADMLDREGNPEIFPQSLYTEAANYYKWLFKLPLPELKVNSFVALGKNPKVKALSELATDDDFCDDYCPEINQFISDNAVLISCGIDELLDLVSKH